MADTGIVTIVNDDHLPATTREIGRVWIARHSSDAEKAVGSIAFTARIIGDFDDDDLHLVESMCEIVREYIARFNGKKWTRKARGGKRGTAK